MIYHATSRNKNLFDDFVAPLPDLQPLVDRGLSVLASLGQGLSLLVPEEGEQAGAEPQGVQHLVLDGGGQALDVVLGVLDGLGANVGVAGDGAVKRGLLLTVGRVGNSGRLFPFWAGKNSFGLVEVPMIFYIHWPHRVQYK